MCPPDHFEVAYEINPWMSTEVRVDVDRAHQQWDSLVAVLRDAGAEIEVLEPQPGLPDLVFTANAGVVDGDLFVPARFRNAERQGETPHDVAWFTEHGFRVAELAPGVSHEGAGDALPAGGGLLSGYRWRSDVASHRDLSRLTGAPVRSVELTDERYYHLDITFCPLDERHALTVPGAWDAYGAKVVDALVPEPLALDLDEAANFTANSVVVGRQVVMPTCPRRVGRQLETWGFDVAVVDVSEFRRAGGAVRCLTLALDVQLGL